MRRATSDLSALKPEYGGLKRFPSPLKVAQPKPDGAGHRKRALMATVVVVVYLWLMVMAFLAYAPILASCMLLLMLASLLFVATEHRWRWHDAQEFENRFWTLSGFVFSLSLLFAPDSPLGVGVARPLVGWAAVLGFTFWAQWYDRCLHRGQISRKSMLKRVESSDLSQMLRPDAKEKTRQVMALISEIDKLFLPSTMRRMFSGAQVVDIEQKIVLILTLATEEELNYILTNVPLALLFYKVKDHQKVASRSQLLELVTVTRVLELKLRTRAMVLHGMQSMRLSANRRSEELAKNVLLSTHGSDLSTLKTILDGSGNVHNLHKLVFIDIKTESVREEILQHFSEQAERRGSLESRGSAHNLFAVADLLLDDDRCDAPSPPRRPVKILSDVDDTLFSSGARFPAGIDKRFPRHQLYPGVLQFYCELDNGPVPVAWDPSVRVGNLAFLSARPHVYKDKSEEASYAKFRRLKETQGMHTLPTLLAGSMDSGLRYTYGGSLEPMAQKKFENFRQFVQLYPEFEHVFVGDNGQGDVRAAELMAAERPDAVKAVFVHEVQPVHKTFGYDRDAHRRWRAMNLYFFRTYIGAGVHARELGLVSPQGLLRVVEQAVRDFNAIPWRDGTETAKEARRVELNLDIRRVNDLLRGAPKMAAYLPARCDYPVGSPVSTPYGAGRVQSFRHEDAVYGVELAWGARAHMQAASLARPVRGAVGMPVLTIYGTGILKGMRSEDGVHRVKLTQLSETSNTAFLQPDAIVREIAAAVGDRVRLGRGALQGVVHAYREADDMFRVRLDWGAFAYAPGSSIELLPRESSEAARSRWWRAFWVSS